MRCKEAKTLFSFYMDNELGLDKINSLKKHLANCPVCCQETQQIQATKGVMQDVLANQKIPALLANFDRKFYRRIEKKSLTWEWLFSYPARLTAAIPRLAIGSVVAAMVFIGVIAIHPGDKKISYGQKDLPLIVKQTLFMAEEIEQKKILDNQAREMLECIL